MDKTLIICLSIWFVGVIILCLAFGDTIRERLRRKKHPVWYTYYDLALKNSFEIGAKFRKRTESINKRRDKVQQMLFQDECTEDEYIDAMKTLAKEYSEAVKWFKLIKKELCIEEDLMAADAYAKEHSLKWGIIYE